MIVSFCGSVELFVYGTAKKYDVAPYVYIMGFINSELKVVVVILLKDPFFFFFTTGESSFNAHSSMLAHMLFTFIMEFCRKFTHLAFMLGVMTAILL